jgi:putative Holliday junction resolvase|tara:strand:+ start:650 stop:1060 length:411 start_codon:yes stop_codon:yes gene_type:complete
MSKIIAIDYGLKRIGIAISDESQILAFGLNTISNLEIISFLREIIEKENVNILVIGKPLQKNNSPSEIESSIILFIKKLNINFPQIIIKRYDERFTSLIAKKTIIEGGIKKMKRRNKDLVDKISATIILQSYLENK